MPLGNPPPLLPGVRLLSAAALVLSHAAPALAADGESAPDRVDPARTAPFYTDHGNLLTLYDVGGNPVRVDSPDLWAERRRAVLHGMERAMGTLPPREGLTPFDTRTVDDIRAPGYRRLTVTFAVEEGDRLSAHLYLPERRDRSGPGGRFPAMLALHQTHPDGKGNVDGSGGHPNLAYGRELAERGYVVLAPDYPSFGDSRDYDFAADRYTSGTMKGIFNHMRCVDFLVARPDVDPERIGVIGHSLGGHNALFAAAFDPRLKAVVSSCGWTPFPDYYGGDLRGWTSARYMPALRDDFGLDPGRVPFDFPEIIAALAPRGFFSNSPAGDDNFAVQGVRRVLPRIAEVYALFGAGDRLQARFPESGHDFPPPVREEAYRFLEAWLGEPR